MGISRTTRLNWILDAGVFFTALVAGFSGFYFLYVPVGGYQGGKKSIVRHYDFVQPLHMG